jgi:hypothetical protein
VSEEREVPSTASTMLVEVMISSRSRAGGEDSERGVFPQFMSDKSRWVGKEAVMRCTDRRFIKVVHEYDRKLLPC